MQTTTENLTGLGQAYVERVAPALAGAEYPLYAIADHTQGHESNDGRRLEGATELAMHAGSHSASQYLDQSLWTWNGSLTNPSFESTNNPLVNNSECSPGAMLNLVTGIAEGVIPCAPEIQDRMLERVSALLFAGATPRELMAEFGDEVGFICKDDEYPSIHVSSGSLFFGAIADRSILAFDVHDIAHHAVQIQQWPQFYSRLGAIGARGFEDDSGLTPFEALQVRHLGGLLMDATIEESLLTTGDGQLHSFGCLNWLSPRDTPGSTIGLTPDISDEDKLLSHRWHSLYAVKDFYRTQQRASEALGMPLDWVERLGYDTDEDFKALSALPENAPLERLDFSAARHIEVIAPRTPSELLSNAQRLLEDLGYWD